MINKALTYLTILAITALPVQLISANADMLNMQMSMNQLVVGNSECLHEMNNTADTAEVEKSCCDNQSHDCQNCNNCAQAVSAMISPSQPMVKISLVKTIKFSMGHSLLNGVPQKNLLRPPRTLI